MKKKMNKSRKKKIYGAIDSRKKIPFRENQLSRDTFLELLRCSWLICFSFTRKKKIHTNISK